MESAEPIGMWRAVADADLPVRSDAVATERARSRHHADTVGLRATGALSVGSDRVESRHRAERSASECSKVVSFIKRSRRIWRSATRCPRLAFTLSANLPW